MTIVDQALLALHRQEMREKKRVRRAKFIWHRDMLRRLEELDRDGVPVDEIARILGIWPETVQSKLREMKAGRENA